MKNDIPTPVVVVVVLLVLAGIGFFAWQRATPHAPPGARPAREGIRESLSKQLGRPATGGYNPKGPD
jgi:hypothetical protein